jgi:hypothetical protein
MKCRDTQISSMAARSLVEPTSRRPCRHTDLEEASNHQWPVSEDTHQNLEKRIA